VVAKASAAGLMIGRANTSFQEGECIPMRRVRMDRTGRKARSDIKERTDRKARTDRKGIEVRNSEN